jgi:tetratricopeptide (TPR) repeat protein
MQKSISYLTAALILLLPLIFWTITPNFFTTPKQLLLIVITSATLIAWLVDSIRRQSLTFTPSSLTFPLIVFITGIIVSIATTQEAGTEALVGRGSLYLASAVLALMISSHSSRILKKLSLTALVLSSTLLSIHSILQLTILHTLPTLPTFMNTRAFSLASTPLITLSLIIIGIATSISWATSTKSNSKRTILLFSTAIQIITVVAYLSLMISGRELVPTLLPLLSSWSIALDSLKSTRNIFLGIGLANFTSFYSSVKPLSLNYTLFWNTLPNSASSELLQLLITGGLVIITPLFLLITSFFSSIKNSRASSLNTPLKVATITTLLILLLTPGSIITIPLLFILLALTARPKSPKVLQLNSSSIFLTTALTLSIVVTALFFSGKLTMAENHLRQAQLAVATNDGQAVYEHHLQAISLVPTLTSYHLSYSQVNLTLAASLSQANELTEDQRTQVTQLLSQAVREARLTTTMRPNLATTWTNLGSIYRQLINVADGAEDLAINNYAQAITLDPANPSLRIELGGIFYQLASTVEDRDTANSYLIRAVEEFSTATQLKSDYANAWYNLAKAYELADNIELAYQAMQQAIASLDVNSPDLDLATQELSTLKAKLPSPTPSADTQTRRDTDTLTTPSPLPSPISGGPIELIPPSPTPEPTPTPSADPSI